MNELQALLGCGRPWAEQRAAYALDLANQFQLGNVSEDEYRELLQDLVRTDTLDAEVDDLEMKSMLVAGVYGLLQIV